MNALRSSSGRWRAPNAVAAFRGLGFGDDVAALGYLTRVGGIRDLEGRPILALPDTPVLRRSVGLIGVHRRRLHAALQMPPFRRVGQRRGAAHYGTPEPARERVGAGPAQ